MFFALKTGFTDIYVADFSLFKPSPSSLWFSFRPSHQHLHSPLLVKITSISLYFCPSLTSSFFCTLNSHFYGQQ